MSYQNAEVYLNGKDLMNNRYNQNLQIPTTVKLESSNPKVWGPKFWASLHISALHYPKKASPIVNKMMQNRILAIPIELPCAHCRPHAFTYIETRKHELETVCSSNTNLFNFYVDFHNYVNNRYNKPIVSYDDARKMWESGIV